VQRRNRLQDEVEQEAQSFEQFDERNSLDAVESIEKASWSTTQSRSSRQISVRQSSWPSSRGLRKRRSRSGWVNHSER
jgi:hypothetical protein